LKKILCATDLSDKSASTYLYAIQKAHENNANILVCHIISQRSIKVAKQVAYFLNESQKDVVKEKAYSALERMKEQLSDLFKKELKDHPEYADHIEHLLVYPGNAAEEIVEKANRFGCEAIVLGSSHSTSFLPRFFLGGTTKKVLKQTKKQVFMVSLKKGKLNISNCNLTRTSGNRKGLTPRRQNAKN
jgi:nucleotide-binding universal stress UspA family protein